MGVARPTTLAATPPIAAAPMLVRRLRRGVERRIASSFIELTFSFERAIRTSALRTRRVLRNVPIQRQITLNQWREFQKMTDNFCHGLPAGVSTSNWRLFQSDCVMNQCVNYI